MLVEIRCRQTIAKPRQLSLLVLSILFLLVLASCIPAKFSGYVPSGPGTLERRYCAGPGIRDVLRIEPASGVRIEVKAGQNRSNNTIELEVSLTIPETVTLQLLEPQFLLESQEWAEPRSLLIDRIMGSGPRPGPNLYGPTDKLAGPLGSPGLFGVWFLKGDKGTLFQTGVPKVNSFTLRFPSLNINGQIYRIDPIKFEAYEKLSIYTCVQ